jgi:hypothetical protein
LVIVAVAASLFPVAFFLVPHWVVHRADFEPANQKAATVANSTSLRLQREHEVRTVAIQALGGLVLLFGSLWTFATFRLSRDAQITERFEKAIDQLGASQVEIKLGGIFALERIARLSAYDHGIVMQVLTSYVRQKAPREREWVSRPTADVQAAVDVLGRRDRGHDPPDYRLPLQDLNLRAAVFGADFADANFQDSDLRGATFARTDLSGARLSRADLRGASLAEARCEGAEFSGAHLEHAAAATAIGLSAGDAHCGAGLGSHER